MQQETALRPLWTNASGTGRGWARTWPCRSALPWALSAEFRLTDYESGWFPFVADNTGPREDQTRILRATLLNRAITVFGFSPQVVFSNQVRESNAHAVRLQT